LPAALVWSHCDDFYIHGPTKEKTTAALTAFLDKAVDVGMLCHPGKLTPPSHTVKYTGLIFDTTTEPTLLIPEDKRIKALAMIDYAKCHHGRISRLALAVVVGLLESLVEATPTRLGHTYLRHLQHTLHPFGWDGDELAYLSYTSLTAEDLREFSMWEWILSHRGRSVRAPRAGTLVPSFGDGSGTGTGGTVKYTEGELFEMWMGVWSPKVYHFSSNWKELQTLKATLERARRQHPKDVTGVTFFYFTVNSTTYFICTSGPSTSPALHEMVEEIKRIKIELGIVLEVVHVPGTTIITEGTDGLSRGIWISHLHSNPSQDQVLSEIFSPVPFTPDVSQWALNEFGLSSTIPCHYRSWELE
jgi:hypothetical protein